jgi:Big-like domain-containing protein
MCRSALIALAGMACLLPAPAEAASAPGGSVKRAEAPKDRRAAERALARAERLRRGVGVRTGRELTGALRELAVGLPALPRDERRAARGLLARPTEGASDPAGFGWASGEASASPHCTADVCVHWPQVAAADAPDLDTTDANGNSVPDYVETMAGEFQDKVRATEVGTLGWRTPPSDGTRGGDGKTDAYVVDFADSGIFGVTVTDPGQNGPSQFSYLLMDDDYSPGEYGGSGTPLAFLQVTAAHEYNHVLQNGYDALQDAWMAESTAVWMEDQVYDSLDDYLRYLDDWAALTGIPMTRFNTASPDDASNIKVYGSIVWNSWLASRYGPAVIRDAWERSLATNPASFGPGAYDAAIRAAGGQGFFDEFARFSAATAEWQATSLGISEPSWSGVPDVARAGALSPDGGDVTGTLDNTTFGLVSVPATGQPLKLIATAPNGTAAAVALVGRSGDPAAGAADTQVSELPNGGVGGVALTPTAGLQRITAVVVNADVSVTGFTGSEWTFARDDQPFSARLSTDVFPPTLTARSPRTGATGVSTTPLVSATFSEPVSGVSGDSFRLTAPGGASEPASVSYDSSTRTATLRPSKPLSDTARYTARLEDGIVDGAANGFHAESWSFTTLRRPPRFLLLIHSRQRRSTVLRRGVSATLRSSDVDTLRFVILAAASRGDLAAARTVGRKRGSLRPSRKVRLRIRLSRTARRVLHRGGLRLLVKATLRDPQGNVRRVRKRVIAR